MAACRQRQLAARDSSHQARLKQAPSTGAVAEEILEGPQSSQPGLVLVLDAGEVLLRVLQLPRNFLHSGTMSHSRACPVVLLYRTRLVHTAAPRPTGSAPHPPALVIEGMSKHTDRICPSLLSCSFRKTEENINQVK